MIFSEKILIGGIAALGLVDATASVVKYVKTRNATKKMQKDLEELKEAIASKEEASKRKDIEEQKLLEAKAKIEAMEKNDPMKIQVRRLINKANKAIEEA